MLSAVAAEAYAETFLFSELLDFKKNVRPGFYIIKKNKFSLFSLELQNKTKQ